MAEVSVRAFRADGVELTFACFAASDGDPGRGIESALAECGKAFDLKNVARQAFFISPTADRAAVEGAIRRTYGGRTPATSIVYEPPFGGATAAGEIWAFTKGAKVKQTGRLSAVEMGGIKWGFVGGLNVGEDEGPYEGVGRALREAEVELKAGGFEFRQVARTWYYIGDLLGPADSGTRYDRFNQARNEFFGSIWKDLRYSPASTGIGMQTRRVAIEALVLDGAEGAFKVTWVDNPLQTKPYVYSINVEQKRKPSFSRGAALTFSDWTMFFVSGTASIRKSEVIYVDDATAQTVATIENIETLFGEENLTKNHGLARGFTLADCMQFRVYVKREKDFAAVREVCAKRLPAAPQSYLLADVCRAQCLVEIEAVAAVKL